jgi:hypothetical protein
MPLRGNAPGHGRCSSVCMFATAFNAWARACHILSVVSGALALVSADAATPSAGVAVLHPSAWSPNDPARDGAEEFEILLRVAQLQRVHRAVGLVAVGDRRGTLSQGGERALRSLVFAGVVVVKLAPNGEVASAPDGLFLEGGTLSAEKTSRFLALALEHHGAPPVAANPEQPTTAERAAIRAHLSKLLTYFAIETGERLALR